MNQQHQQAMYKRAQMLLKTGEFDAAEEVCANILELFPEDAILCACPHKLWPDLSVMMLHKHDLNSL